MKIICVGDPHFKVDNIEEVEVFISKLKNLLEGETPDYIIILGDILHTHEKLHTIPLNKAYDLVDICSRISPTYVLVGNHDYIQNSQFLTTNHWMNGMKKWKNVVVVDKPIFMGKNNFKFLLLPYVPPGRFSEALEEAGEDWKDSTCIFCHQEFYGCKMGAIVSVEGDKWEESYPYIVSGHIHNKQEIGKNIYYCGSAMQNAFGESEINIIPILTWETPDRKYGLREVDLGLQRKKILYTDINNIENIDTEKEGGDKVKISISGIYDDFKAFKKTKKYKELIKKGTKVVFKPKKIDVKEAQEQKLDLEKSEERDFNTILSILVSREKNNLLYQVFQEVVNSKIVEEDEILFI